MCSNSWPLPFAFIRAGQLDDTFRLCETLLDDAHDLMHKACGWMLRGCGKRDVTSLRSFLENHAARMPRTMLRYAIEKLSPAESREWLARPGKKSSRLLLPIAPGL